MNITKLPSGSYRIRETVNGVTYSKTVKFKPKKYEAEQIIADMVETGESSMTRMTVKEAMEKYIELKEKSLSPSTIAAYTGYIKVFPTNILNTHLSAINEYDLQIAINKLAIGKSTKYIKNLISFLTSSIKMFRKKLILDIVIPDDNRPKNEAYEPTDEDIKKVISAIEGTKFEVPIKLAMLGLRRSEICALTIEDIGDCSATINKVLVRDKNKNWVIKNKMKNGAPERTVYIPKSLEERIRQQGYIYKGCPELIYDKLSNTLKSLGIEHFPLHRLRHYYASVSHALGVPDEYIMLNGGWKSDTVLKKVYRHAQKDRVEALGEPVREHYKKLMG